MDSNAVWDGSVNWFLFEDAGGMPSDSPFASGAGVNASRELRAADVKPADPVGFFDSYAYWFDLDVPVALSADVTYWLGLDVGITSGPSIFWETTGSPTGNAAYLSSGGTFDNWATDNLHLAFQLTNDRIPEPASLALFGFGLLGLGAMRRRRRTA